MATDGAGRKRIAPEPEGYSVTDSGPPSLLDYAEMAYACYTREDSKKLPGWDMHGWYNVTIGKAAITLASFINDSNIVLAFSGTDPKNFNHLSADLAIGIGVLPASANKANEIFELILRTSNGRRPSLVGHSLGGALAQYVGFKFPYANSVTPIRYTTFCAPGIARWFEKRPETTDGGVNYFVENDWVHTFGGAKTGKSISLGKSPASFPACHTMGEVLKLVRKHQ
jgi:hypothetical protein